VPLRTVGHWPCILPTLGSPVEAPRSCFLGSEMDKHPSVSDTKLGRRDNKTIARCVCLGLNWGVVSSFSAVPHPLKMYLTVGGAFFQTYDYLSLGNSCLSLSPRQGLRGISRPSPWLSNLLQTRSQGNPSSISKRPPCPVTTVRSGLKLWICSLRRECACPVLLVIGKLTVTVRYRVLDPHGLPIQRTS